MIKYFNAGKHSNKASAMLTSDAIALLEVVIMRVTMPEGKSLQLDPLTSMKVLHLSELSL